MSKYSGSGNKIEELSKSGAPQTCMKISIFIRLWNIPSFEKASPIAEGKDETHLLSFAAKYFMFVMDKNVVWGKVPEILLYPRFRYSRLVRYVNVCGRVPLKL